jgi:hypothetical protein
LKRELFEMPDYEGAGVYALVNIVDFKAYIGASKKIKNRARSHENAIKTKTHCNKGINEDSEKHFKFIVLQKVDKEVEPWILHLLEKMYMLEMSCLGFELYNIQPQRSVGSYKDMCIDIAQDVIYNNGTKQRIETEIKEKYGANTWHLKARKPENRAINETMERDKKGLQ